MGVNEITLHISDAWVQHNYTRNMLVLIELASVQITDAVPYTAQNTSHQYTIYTCYSSVCFYIKNCPRICTVRASSLAGASDSKVA